jgi:hypothetical protein
MANLIKNRESRSPDGMVPKAKTISIFKKLFQQTQKGNVEWRELEPGTYLADVGECSLRLHSDMLSIYDNMDNLLDSITNDDLPREKENIGLLFECAKKSALKVYEKLNALEKVLDGIL